MGYSALVPRTTATPRDAPFCTHIGGTERSCIPAPVSGRCAGARAHAAPRLLGPFFDFPPAPALATGAAQSTSARIPGNLNDLIRWNLLQLIRQQ